MVNYNRFQSSQKDLSSNFKHTVISTTVSTTITESVLSVYPSHPVIRINLHAPVDRAISDFIVSQIVPRDFNAVNEGLEHKMAKSEISVSTTGTWDGRLMMVMMAAYVCVCVFDVASRRGWIYCSPGRLALHATILTFSAVTDSCSNLKLGFSTINVHTSSQKR